MNASTTVHNMFPHDARPAAEWYARNGYAPIPLPVRSKDPALTSWPALRITSENLDAYFPIGHMQNIGILNGAASGNIADVDLDCPEAIDVAMMLLPVTGGVFGRASAPNSHWFYRTDEPLDAAQVPFEDLDGSMILELRGTGGHTLAPPSIHPSGERIVWHKFESLAEIKLETLKAGASAVAAAALLARHWPAKGSRDKAAMALTGALLRAWDEPEVSKFVEAVAVAAGDEEYHARAGKAKPTAAKQESGKETTGWPTLIELLGERGEQVVERVQEWLDVTNKAPVELPVPAETPWPDPLPEEAFHGIAGEIVRVIEPYSEADPAALLFQNLVGLGNIIGREVYFQVEADRHYCNEYVVLVGRTAKARKGTSWGHTSYFLRKVDENWLAERVQSGLSSGEGLIWAVRDPISKREKTKKDNEVMYVEVEADPGIEDKRLQIIEPEFANVLKQIERQCNTLSVILRLAWDGGQCLRSMTKNSPAKATGAHVSLIGHITVEELRRLLNATEIANGTGNRVLWVASQRSKLLPEGGNLDRRLLDDLAIRVADLITKGRSVGRIVRDDDARSLWAEVYGDLSEGRPGLSGALMARSEAHVMRLSMIYAILDGEVVVRVPHLMAALALWNYVEQTIRHVFGDSLGDAVADEILLLLRNAPKGLTRTEIRDFFGRHGSDRTARALGLLLQHGKVRRAEQKTRGRPVERWFAVKK